MFCTKKEKKTKKKEQTHTHRQKQNKKKNDSVNISRRRWNRTTEHISSPTDLKSALHTNEGHPRIIIFKRY